MVDRLSGHGIVKRKRSPVLGCSPAGNSLEVTRNRNTPGLGLSHPLVRKNRGGYFRAIA